VNNPKPATPKPAVSKPLPAETQQPDAPSVAEEIKQKIERVRAHNLVEPDEDEAKRERDKQLIASSM